MQAGEKPIQDVIKKENLFFIPPYQRPYTWDEENTKQLLCDIKEAIDNGEQEYFIGSIVTVETRKNAEYEVVDGQQRITTLSIVFSALHDLVAAAGLKERLRDRLFQVDVYEDPPIQMPRLKVRTQDTGVYEQVVLNSENIVDTSTLSDSELHILKNKRAALDFFGSFSQAELKKFAQYLEKQVYLVFISAEQFDSALRLFNVLNARGVPLGNSDLIKSHLYGLVKDKKAFEQSWNNIEADVGISELDAFFGHLRTSLVGDKARATLFVEIQSYLKSNNLIAENFVKMAEMAAELYAQIFSNQVEPPSIRKYVWSLRAVNHDDWVPPLLGFLLAKRVLDLDKKKFIPLLEKITYQMWIAGNHRDARNQVYYKLLRAIKTPGASLLSVFSSEKLSSKLEPNLSDDLYGRGFARAVLLRMEMEAQDDSVEKFFNGTITIEHVLPQDPSDKYWSSRFSSDEHRKWVHKLGNLTLLSGPKNSSAQKYDFDKKKIVYNERNKKVSFDLTKEVCAKGNWTPIIVKHRHEKLVDEAKDIWWI